MTNLIGGAPSQLLQSAMTGAGPLDPKAIPRSPIMCALAADYAGADSATAQKAFNASTAGTVQLRGDTAYEFEMLLMITRAAGTTSHTTGILFAGTATLTSINYVAQVSNPTGNILAAVSQIRGDAATEVVLTAANTSATENLAIKVRGVIRIANGGTLIPQFKYSSAPGGVPTVKANSFIKLVPLGDVDDDLAATVGVWS
jgi:hypothetical protein